MQKKLGLISATALVTGNMIGSGFFLLPSAMARLGSLTLISWIISTIGSIFLAFVFMQVIQRTQSSEKYVEICFGRTLGFQTAYCHWASIWIGNAAIALAAVGYLSVFVPILEHPIWRCVSAISLIWIFTALNMRGIRVVGIFQIISTAIKLIPLLLILVAGWFFFQKDFILQSLNVTRPSLSAMEVITQGATLTLWAFSGFESAALSKKSIDHPQKTIPRATILGMLFSGGFYILGSIIIMGVIPNHQLQTSSSPFADAAEMIFGTYGRWIVASGAVISCLGALNGWILLQGQVPMHSAQNNLFFKIFARQNKNKIPISGLVISSTLISCLLLLTLSSDLINQFKIVLLMATLAALVGHLYTPVTEILITQKTSSYARNQRIIAIIAILYSFWAIIGTGTDILAYGLILILSSIPFYLLLLNTRPKKSGF